MRRREQRNRIKLGLVVCALALAPLHPLMAAEQVTLPDGAVLSVWEARARAPRATSASSTGGALAWSLCDATGIRGSGVIAPTGDTAADTDPRLALDPATGGAFLLWSRAAEGTYKVHYARFDGASWIDPHALTFGPGSDRQPRVGFDTVGATLFYMVDGVRYFHAAFDPGFGRLFAAPRALPHLGNPRPGGPFLRSGGGLFVDGGFDSPVPPGDKDCTGGCTSSSGIIDAGGATTQGGWDTPVPPNQGGKPTGSNKALAWGVAGDSSCTGQVLVVPAREYSGATVYRYRRGEISVLNRIALPSPIQPGFGDLTARTYLPSVCY